MSPALHRIWLYDSSSRKALRRKLPLLRPGRLDMVRVGLRPQLVAVRCTDALSGHMTVNENTQAPALITVPEAARRLAIGRTLTYELIAANELPCVRIGRAIRVPAEAIEAFVERRVNDDQTRVAT